MEVNTYANLQAVSPQLMPNVCSCPVSLVTLHFFIAQAFSYLQQNTCMKYLESTLTFLFISLLFVCRLSVIF